MRVPRRLILALLWTTALVAVAWLQLFRFADPTYPGMPWQEPHQLGDFRDAVWLPGRFLLDGGNPYDVEAYLAAHPWAQEFNLYAPVWLVLAAGFGALPFQAAAGAYLVLGGVLAVAFLVVALRRAAPGMLSAGVPLGLLWFTLWSPARYALQNGGTFAVFAGCVLALLAIAQGAGARLPGRAAALPGRAPGRWTAAAGVALALLKPQFGLPLVVLALAVRRWDVVWRGCVVLGVASLPVVVRCSAAAGGFGAFLGSVRGNLAYSSSPDSPTGLASPFNGRIDLLGLAARLGMTDQPSWAGLMVPLLLIAVGGWLVRRTGDALAVTTVAAVVTLLSLVHQPYDTVVLVLPTALAARELLAWRRGGPRPTARRAALWVAAGLPVLHLHAGTLLVLPALGRTGADLVDVAAMVTALVLVALGAAAPHPPAGVQEVSGATAGSP